MPGRSRRYPARLPLPRRFVGHGCLRSDVASCALRTDTCVVDTPETRYARSGDLWIAYQVAGEGPFDLVLVPGATSHLEFGWQVPSYAALFRHLASFARLIRFDKRGTGMSDAVVGAAPLEERMDDVRAVMDAVGSERAAVFGISEGVPMSILFAVTYPERTWALVLYGGMARWVWAPDHPWMPTEAEYRERIEAGRRSLTNRREFLTERVRFGSADADEEEARAIVEHLLYGASPGAVEALAQMNMAIDVRAVLSSVRVPTLVLHRTGDELVRVENGRYLAERIPGAAYVEYPGPGHWSSQEIDQLASELEHFVTGVWEFESRQDSEPDRVLSTALFTDIVGSSEKAAALGDRAWSELLQQHHELVRRLLVRFRGRELDTAGDGFFASFDGPARAIRCACAIVEGVKEVDLNIRAGLHTGECELVDGKVAGIAVHTGARVASHAQPGEVLVSSTVKDLVAGSGITFSERATTELKGIPGEWHLYAVEAT
jgi:class 3 adenylate cyclase/pimeloyl-ACP methyl ester carboxylesterase